MSNMSNFLSETEQKRSLPQNLRLKTAISKRDSLISLLRDMRMMRRIEFKKGTRVPIRHYSLSETCNGGMWTDGMITATTIYSALTGLRYVDVRVKQIYTFNLHK